MKSGAARSFLALWLLCGHYPCARLRTALAFSKAASVLPTRRRLDASRAARLEGHDKNGSRIGAAMTGRCFVRGSMKHDPSPPALDASADRRGAILAVGSLSAALAAAAMFSAAVPGAAADIRGTPVTPFNSLMFQYRGSDFAGLRAEDLGEPSISYGEFVEGLKSGKVAFVEFLAPDGDAAYATLKGREEGPIRIGEGYPIEQHDGYSSPAFAIRAVQNAGVPYKFVVPGLAKYSALSSAARK